VILIRSATAIIVGVAILAACSSADSPTATSSLTAAPAPTAVIERTSPMSIVRPLGQPPTQPISVSPTTSTLSGTSPPTVSKGVAASNADQPTSLPGANNDQSTPPRPDSAFSLLTHCGINGAMIDGRWWTASPQLNDGNGNPPAGWDNPSQIGTLHFTSDDTVTFDAGNSRTVTLHRTTSTDYPFICS